MTNIRIRASRISQVVIPLRNPRYTTTLLEQNNKGILLAKLGADFFQQILKESLKMTSVRSIKSETKKSSLTLSTWEALNLPKIIIMRLHQGKVRI
jgi:hypothetical protein